MAAAAARLMAARLLAAGARLVVVRLLAAVARLAVARVVAVEAALAAVASGLEPAGGAPQTTEPAGNGIRSWLDLRLRLNGENNRSGTACDFGRAAYRSHPGHLERLSSCRCARAQSLQSEAIGALIF